MLRPASSHPLSIEQIDPANPQHATLPDQKGKPTLIWQLPDLETLPWKPETIGAGIATSAALHSDLRNMNGNVSGRKMDHED
jgi:hypothetical protein